MQWSSGYNALSCSEFTVNNFYSFYIIHVLHVITFLWWEAVCGGRDEESVWFNSRTGHAGQCNYGRDKISM